MHKRIIYAALMMLFYKFVHLYGKKWLKNSCSIFTFRECMIITPLVFPRWKLLCAQVHFFRCAITINIIYSPAIMKICLSFFIFKVWVNRFLYCLNIELDLFQLMLVKNLSTSYIAGGPPDTGWVVANTCCGVKY